MHPVHLNPRRTLALLSAAVLLLGASLAAPTSAAAEATVPDTLSRTASLGERPEAPPIRIDFLGVHWRGAESARGAVRFRRNGHWGAWRALHRGDLHPFGRFASTLVAARGATAYQVRAPQAARDVRGVTINTSDGPRHPLRRASKSAAAAGTPADSAGPPRKLCLRERKGWGADEALRFDAMGTEIWPPQFFAVQRLTVHHTVTESGGSDPAAVVRAIYRYHAVELGFGDIGYHLLVDHRGCVYEGRYSGPDPVPVFAGLPTVGAPPMAVNGGHVTGFNAGNAGVALIGEFTQAEPTRRALRSLTRTLAVLAKATRLDPLASGTYVNPISGATQTTAVISGHRDWLATECPGERLYARLPEIRRRVAALVGT